MDDSPPQRGRWRAPPRLVARHYAISAANRILIWLFVFFCLLTLALHAAWLATFFDAFLPPQWPVYGVLAATPVLLIYAGVFQARYRISQQTDRIRIQFAFRQRELRLDQICDVAVHQLLGVMILSIWTERGARRQRWIVPILSNIDENFLFASVSSTSAPPSRSARKKKGLLFLMAALLLQVATFAQINKVAAYELWAFYLLPYKPLPESAQSNWYRLLRAGEFNVLAAELQTLQQQFVTGLISDQELLAASREAYAVDRTLAHHYQDWLNRQPESVPAHQLAGIFYKYLFLQYVETPFYAHAIQARMVVAHWAKRHARHHLGQCLQRDPDNLLCALHWLDVANDRQEALRVWQRVDQRYPDNLILKRKHLLTLSPQLGGSIARMTDYLDALRTTGASTEVQQKLAALVDIERAYLAEQAGDQTSYRSHLQQALQRGTDDGAALRRLAKLALDEKRYSDVLQLAEQALARNAQDERALGYAGFALQQLGRFDEAARHYLLAAELGDAYSQTQIAKFFWEGLGVKRDRQQTVYWLDQAIARGYAAAISDRAKVQQLLAESP